MDLRSRTTHSPGREVAVAGAGWRYRTPAAVGLTVAGALAVGVAILDRDLSRGWTFASAGAVLLVCGGTLLGMKAIAGHPVVAWTRTLGRRRGERLMRSVVDHSFDAIVAVADDGTVEMMNPSARRMFVDPAGRAVGAPAAELIRPRGDDGDAASLQEILNGDPRLYEADGVRGDGTAFPVEVSVGTVRDETREVRVLFVRDITHRKLQQEALVHQATHDPLTGLPNRLKLHETLDAALSAARRRAEPVAVVLLDLDRFKDINDTLGHPTGDALLQQIAHRLNSVVRPADTVARLGGDEFAVVLPGGDRWSAEIVSQRLVEAIRSGFEIGEMSLQVGTSIGIAIFPEHDESSAGLIQRADVALYVAKKSRGRAAVYRPEDDCSSVRQLTLNGELRRAISEDGLELHFQPKVSATERRTVSLEALVRWVHPTQGMLPPDEFIALAEYSGLIRPLTYWVIEHAVAACAGWRQAGMPVGVAVNLSARNLLEPDLPGEILELLRRNGLEPEALTLEITESLIMDDPDRSMEIVTRLHGMGCGISIDDFGTGYSSLAYLKRLPAGEIKIDRSFVTDMVSDHEDAVIVRSTIEMGHSLGMRVVAEGVESDLVWDELCRLGCDFGQGFLFSKPLPRDKLEPWLRSSPWGLRKAGSGDVEGAA